MVSVADIPPETLVSIFEWSERHKDLLNYALVCHRWTEWAIDTGWRTCEVPLSEVLAILDLTHEPDTGVGDAAWIKFAAVSNKVTKVKSNFVLTTQGALNYSRRRDEHSGDTLFQNVRQLILPMGSTDFQTASIACSSGAPKSIRMKVVPGSRSETGWMFQTTAALSLAGRAPNVESIHADYMFSYDAPIFSPFARLRVLECYSFAVGLRWWKDLATCQNLAELRLRETSTDVQEWPERSGVVFPRLQKVHYTGGSERALELISKSSFPALKRLVLLPCPSPQHVERITVHLKAYSPLLREFRSAEYYVAQQ